MTTAIMVLGGITLVLALLLVAAHRLLRVTEDTRIDTVADMLPQSNCGACGYPGCRAFAEALVAGKTQPGECTVSSAEGRQDIADFLGIQVTEVAKRVARLACAGGDNVARFQAQYKGIQTCQAAAQVAGGGKWCTWGCLGFGDCAEICAFDAIDMNHHNLPVVIEDNCTACGDCVRICPKDLFSIHPADHRLWVACQNQEKGDDLLEKCAVACTACERCAFDAPQLITMENHLPVIDYHQGHHTQMPIQRCPTGAIVWLESDGTVVKGKDAVEIFRQSPLRKTPS